MSVTQVSPVQIGPKIGSCIIKSDDKYLPSTDVAVTAAGLCTRNTKVAMPVKIELNSRLFKHCSVA